MSSLPNPAAAIERQNEPPHWLGFVLNWKLIAWPATGALLAALCHFFGYVAESGTRATLGIDHLDRAAVSQSYIILGAIVLGVLAQSIAIVVAAMMGLFAAGKLMFRQLPDRVQARLGTIIRLSIWGWIVISIAVATSALALRFAMPLMRDADGMILKPAREVGIAWMRVSLDEDKAWLSLYELLLSTATTIFVSLSWWLLTRFFRSNAAKAVYGTWAMLDVFLLVGSFAFIYGCGATFRDYPIVAFSNVQQLCGKDAVPVLIGSDDKLFAFLVLHTPALSSETTNPRKYLLYLPRTEIKWIIVVRQAPLHVIAQYQDLKNLLPSIPSTSEPKPDASSPEIHP